MSPIPNGPWHYELGIYRGGEGKLCPPITKPPDWVAIKKALQYEQFCRRAQWFTLAAFDYELYMQQRGDLWSIDFELYCEIRAAIYPPPRDPFDPIPPIAFHESYGSIGIRTYDFFAMTPEETKNEHS